jgi:predicted N-acetyltransferase YhbS
VELDAIEGPRACTPDDLPQVIELVDEAMRRGSDQTMWTDYPLVYHHGNLDNIRIMTVGGKVVTVVPFIPRDIVVDGCNFRIGIISPTATAPAYRHRGFGLRCLHSCIQEMERSQCQLSVLWTMVETFPFYQHGEYQAVRPQAKVYKCSGSDANHFADHGHPVVEYEPRQDWTEAIRSLHERESYGVRRSPAEYPVLLQLPKMRTLLAMANGAPVAFLIVSRATNKPGLIEAGGDEAGVETLVHRVLTDLGSDDTIPAHANLTETMLERVLARHLAPAHEPGLGGMMIRINDVRGFLGRISGILEYKNGGVERAFSATFDEPDETVSFQFSRKGVALGAGKQAQDFAMSRREWTSVIFGSHPARPVPLPAALSDLFPVYFPIWVLDRS